MGKGEVEYSRRIVSGALTVEVRSKAADDISAAAQWYEQRAQGLGAEFVRAIDACLSKIARNPEAYPVVHRDARMALPRRFPYKVIYSIDVKTIIVVAVMHGHRHPKRWRGRVG